MLSDYQNFARFWPNFAGLFFAGFSQLGPGEMCADPTGYREVTPQGPRSLHFRGKRPIPRLLELVSARSSARPLSAAALRDHHRSHPVRLGRRQLRETPWRVQVLVGHENLGCLGGRFMTRRGRGVYSSAACLSNRLQYSIEWCKSREKLANIWNARRGW